MIKYVMPLTKEEMRLANRYDIWTPKDALIVEKRLEIKSDGADPKLASQLRRLLELSNKEFNLVPSFEPVYRKRKTKKIPDGVRLPLADARNEYFVDLFGGFRERTSSF
jgi:hypothetical protein